MTVTGIRRQPLDLGELIAAVSHEAAGAVASFLGVVRNHNEGLIIERLDYHVYETMADKELAAIVAEVEAEIEGVRVACTLSLIHI